MFFFRNELNPPSPLFPGVLLSSLLKTWIFNLFIKTVVPAAAGGGGKVGGLGRGGAASSQNNYSPGNYQGYLFWAMRKNGKAAIEKITLKLNSFDM